ncbi:MAG TPA: hypothetical protein VK498_08555 [Ferruginibacter sp.]|nr:hypothetical protein [Ferruginibacter sp.]
MFKRTGIFTCYEANCCVDNQKRKSHTSIGRIYFWTATVHKWRYLLEGNRSKQLVVDYLKELSFKKFITVYGFVIMPNHIHVIWRLNKLNGKESPKASFLKYTAHEFLKQLKNEGKACQYKVNALNKDHEIWQRDSLGVEIYSRHVAMQKLDYIHANPVSGKWLLAKDDIRYHYSSAHFYETGVDSFGFLNNLYNLFDGE